MFINFVNTGLSPSGKTQMWSVQSTSGQMLGEVRWFSQWRRYAFTPQAYTLYDAGCLREVADFVERETREHNDRLQNPS